MSGRLAPRPARPAAEATPARRPRMRRQVRLFTPRRRLQLLVGVDLSRPRLVLKLTVHVNEGEKLFLRQLHPSRSIRDRPRMCHDAPDAPLPIQLVQPHIDGHADHVRSVQIRNHAGRLKRRGAHTGQLAADRTSRWQRWRQCDRTGVHTFTRHFDAINKHAGVFTGISPRIVKAHRERQLPLPVAVLQLEGDAVAARQIPFAGDTHTRITQVAFRLDREQPVRERERPARLCCDRRQRRLRRIKQYDVPRVRDQGPERQRDTQQISHPVSSLRVETNYKRPFRNGQPRSCELNPRFCEHAQPTPSDQRTLPARDTATGTMTTPR